MTCFALKLHFLISFIISVVTCISPNLEQRASSVPTAYPQPLLSTKFSDDPFVLLVSSSNSALNFRSVQVASGGIAVVDNVNSPVLALQLRRSNLYSQRIDLSNSIHDDGRVGGLRNLTTVNGTTQQAFIFRANDQSAGAGFKQSLNKWQLFSFGDAGNYGLYHNERTEVTNGFVACPTTQGSATRWEIRYYVSTNQDGGESGTKGCEFIGIDTTIAPKINETGVYFK